MAWVSASMPVVAVSMGGQAARQFGIEHGVIRNEREIVDGVFVARGGIGDNGGEGRFAARSGGGRHGDEQRRAF